MVGQHWLLVGVAAEGSCCWRWTLVCPALVVDTLKVTDGVSSCGPAVGGTCSVLTALAPPSFEMQGMLPACSSAWLAASPVDPGVHPADTALRRHCPSPLASLLSGTLVGRPAAACACVPPRLPCRNRPSPNPSPAARNLGPLPRPDSAGQVAQSLLLLLLALESTRPLAHVSVPHADQAPGNRGSEGLRYVTPAPHPFEYTHSVARSTAPRRAGALPTRRDARAVLCSAVLRFTSAASPSCP